MFNGSENFNDDYFKALERVGATDMNGTTNEDRTNYFERRAQIGARSGPLDGVRPDGPFRGRHLPGAAR